ncbi:serine/threonine-protein kinase [Streptomyces beijiangensis]|uniref:non-specific serine/threonine protein kinase n=1 Tax=Streptomyces beijiangensis TaxID=163361 RepID=A0A939FG89_9ACTN|nr:serine/threonine-protein kinase [Streptomyces beijiangensis]MBO0517388.1 serine/threonine protein kinase [Streptomyces beijiangensis]
MLAGRYRLGELIGRGGMGKVWRAHDEVLHRTVAVKELTAGLFVSEADRTVLHARTQKEARAAARINHPGVVTVHDVIAYDDRPWIVMEYVDGPSLADVAKESGALAPREAARIGLHVLGALRAAHAAGVLHRDVKPGNILLARDGRVLITDFGIAAIEGDSEITRTGEIVGSIDYLAPERIQGEAPGPASDLFSLGATLYTAVEERSPFRRTSPISTLQAVVTEEPPPPENAGALAPVITALLRKDPADRPSVAEAERMLLDAMEGRAPKQAQAFVPTQNVPKDLLERATVHLPEPESAPPAPAAPAKADDRKRHPVRTAVLVVALAAVVGGGVGLGVMKYQDGKDSGSGEQTMPTVPDTTPAKTPGTKPPGKKNPDGLPDGWTKAVDPAGFSLAIPKGWSRQVDGEQIDYTPDNGAHRIRISVDTAPDFANPYAHMLNIEPQLGRLPNYQRVSLHTNTFRDQPAALWEFTWTETKDHPGKRRAIDQMYNVDNGRVEYAIYMSSPVGDWVKTRAQFDIVLQHWQPN